MSLPLKKLLHGLLPDEAFAELVGSYDIVGDIAVIIIPESCEPWQALIAGEILANHPHVSVVAKRAGNYDGEFRLLPLQVLAGEDRTVTELRESGVRLRLDLAQAYYSVRSGGERLRIARMVADGERVLVAFSGVGPYPLVISQHSGAREIVAVEKNGSAHQYALQSFSLNKKLKNINFYHEDISAWLGEDHGLFDRIIMPLPKTGATFLSALLPVLSSRGWIHFYDMQLVDSFEKSFEFIEGLAQQAGRKILYNNITACGHCGPRTYRICVDVKLE